ncbi:MAG: tautomerase family protein [Spirochaetes bacterium]|nr:tautomerase family protein [Spirochaetota bacterium]
MPIVKVNVLKGLSSAEKKEIHDAIHQSLVSALKIEDWDYFHRLYEFSKEDFIFPESKSDRFILIEIHLFSGRTKEQKANLYKILCDSLENIGIPRMDIFIQVLDPPLENWGIRGGLPASDIFNK